VAQAFPGWTLEYIDALDPFDLADVWGVLDGDQKVTQDNRRQMARLRRR
jgi:hypothetical protein